MGLLGTLGKLGGMALDFVPGGGAAKTGVKIAKGIAKGAEAAGDVGSVLGKQQAGAAQGKMTQAELGQRQDQNALANYIAQQNAQNTAANTDLQRKSFEQNSRGTNAKQALIGALLGGGVKPTHIGPGESSGGLLNSLNANPDALAAMKLLGSQGATAQNTPLAFQGGQMLKAPSLTPLPKIDNGGIMSTLARIGELMGAASPYLKGKGEDDPSRPQLQYANGAIGGLPGTDIGMPQAPADAYANHINPNIFKRVNL